MLDLLNLEPNKISSSPVGKIFMIYGQPKTRKTTVASQFPNALIAGFEKGYQFLNGVYVVNIQKWTDFTALVRELKKPQVKDKYQTIIIDTISISYKMVYKAVCDRFGVDDPGQVGYAKAWNAIRDEYQEAINSIVRLGYGLVLIAHADEREQINKKGGKESSSVTIKTDIPRQVHSFISGLADFTLYVTKEEKDGSSNETTVYAYSDLADIETGSRARYMPKRFEFTYENLMNALDQAIQTQLKVENIKEATGDSNPYIVEEESFEDLQARVIKYISYLAETGAVDTMMVYFNEHFPNMRVSETTIIHKPKLHAAADFLLKLGDQLGVDLDDPELKLPNQEKANGAAK
jgi:hypothetical protein